MQGGWRFVVAVLVAGLAGCAAPYRSPVFATRPGDSVEFTGLAHLLQPQRPLDVLLVHGMCTHDGDWAAGAVGNLYASVGGDARKVKLVKAPVEGTPIELWQQTLVLQGDRMLRVNAVVWSPLTTPLKNQLCYDQTNKSATCPPEEAAKTYPYRRAHLNRLLKDKLLDDCLADALIYQGRSRDEISAGMQKAVLQAVATSGGSGPSAGNVAMTAMTAAATAAAVPETVPLVVVTESLGSKVAFDALYKLVGRPETRAAGLRTFDRTSHVFMNANQLPILALADRTLDGKVAERAAAAAGDGAEGGYPVDPLDALVRQRGLRSRSATGVAAVPPLQVVAFTDPNDLLSFILVPSRHAEETAYPVIDVIVSNAGAPLGLLELPTTAHLGYRANDAVRRLIACGHPAGAACPP